MKYLTIPRKAKARDAIKEQLDQKKEAFAKARENGPQKNAYLEAKKGANETVASFQKTASRDLIDREEALKDLKSQGSIIVIMAFWVLLILEMSGFLAKAFIGLDGYDNKKWAEELDSMEARQNAQIAAYAREVATETARSNAEMEVRESRKANGTDGPAKVVRMFS